MMINMQNLWNVLLILVKMNQTRGVIGDRGVFALKAAALDNLYGVYITIVFKYALKFSIRD